MVDRTEHRIGIANWFAFAVLVVSKSADLDRLFQREEIISEKF